jgi:hypothetical protein
MSGEDRFGTFTEERISSPAVHAFPITPGTPFTQTTRAVYVGSSGRMTCTMASGAEVTFEHINKGCVLPIHITAVSASNTNAGDILGLC